MNRELLKKLERLEKEIRPTVSFEEFQEEWKDMDELSKSLYVTIASCPELVASATLEEKRICEYLERMGIVGSRFLLSDIVQDLEKS